MAGGHRRPRQRGHRAATTANYFAIFALFRH